MGAFIGFPISRWSLLLLCGDILLFCLAIPGGFFLSHKPGDDFGFFLETYGPVLLGVLFTYVIILYIANLYDQYEDFRQRANISRVILSTLVATVVVELIFSFGLHAIHRRVIEWHAVVFIWLVALWRYSFSAVALPQRLQRQVLIIGAGQAGQEICRAIQHRRNSGLKVAGFIDDDPGKANRLVDGLPVLGNSDQIQAAIQQHSISLVVVAITHEKSHTLINNLTRLTFNGVKLTDMSSLYELLAGKIPIDHISDMWLFVHNLNRSMIYYSHFKRITDLVLAAIMLMLVWPLFIIIGLLIKLDSDGPAFYRQERLGQDGQPFQIIKFRTMYKDAERQGPQFARRNDPRITRVGRWLRRLRLDEMPQLLNIFKGQMSFIGPRPEREVFIQEYQELVPFLRVGRRGGDPDGVVVLCGYHERLPYYSYRLVVKPGITGWAQVMHYYAGSLEETREKLQYDLYYVKNMGFFLDLAILLKTIRIVLFGRGR